MSKESSSHCLALKNNETKDYIHMHEGTQITATGTYSLTVNAHFAQ